MARKLKTGLMLLGLGALHMPPVVPPVAAETEALEFRHGVSQIPNYELKYPRDFTHFDYVNLDAPKGGTLVLPYSWRYNTVSPLYQPYGTTHSYDQLLVRAGDEVSGYYCSLAESVAVSADGYRIVFRLRPRPAGTMACRLPQPT